MRDAQLSVLIMEDNRIISRRFERILSAWAAVSRVECCETLQQAVEIINNGKVDLLIADLNLPDGSGVDAIRLLCSQQPGSHAIVISAINQRQIVIDAISAGAMGYLLKDDEALEIINSCEAVISGESPMSASIARLMIEAVQEKHRVMPSVENPLTEKETDVITAIAKGYSYKEVATLHQISVQTVQVHIRNIYRKLRIKNRLQAAEQAKELGLISP